MRTDLPVTLYFLSYAGGNAYNYLPFKKKLAPWIQMEALDYAGHGPRFSEPLNRNMDGLVNDVFCQIQSRLQQQYAVMGHSLGGGVAWLLTHKLIAAGFPPPRHLFISGRRGPSRENPPSGRYLLPTPDFLKMVFEFEGTPKELLQNPELLELFEPVLRADFQANDTWRYQPHPPLEVPITVLTGTIHDISPEDAQAWQQETTHPLTVHTFEGNHFFIFQYVAEICHVIERTLQSNKPSVFSRQPSVLDELLE